METALDRGQDVGFVREQNAENAENVEDNGSCRTPQQRREEGRILMLVAPAMITCDLRQQVCVCSE